MDRRRRRGAVLARADRRRRRGVALARADRRRRRGAALARLRRRRPQQAIPTRPRRRRPPRATRTRLRRRRPRRATPTRVRHRRQATPTRPPFPPTHLQTPTPSLALRAALSSQLPRPHLATVEGRAAPSVPCIPVTAPNVKSESLRLPPAARCAALTSTRGVGRSLRRSASACPHASPRASPDAGDARASLKQRAFRNTAPGKRRGRRAPARLRGSRGQRASARLPNPGSARLRPAASPSRSRPRAGARRAADAGR